MRFLFLLLTLILQLNVSGYNLHNPQENHEIKILTAENEDFNERSCILFRYYDSSIGSYISQDPIGLAGGNSTFYGYVKDVNSWVDIFGLTVDNLIRYKPDKIKPQTGSRGTAIDRAWKEEQVLINRTGKGTRDWTPDEIALIKNGKSGKELTSTMSNAGYTGHHINNVSDFPHLKGDPRNIVFLQNANHPSGIDEHLLSKQGHRGNYDNQSKGRLIDRKHSH